MRQGWNTVYVRHACAQARTAEGMDAEEKAGTGELGGGGEGEWWRMETEGEDAGGDHA